ILGATNALNGDKILPVEKTRLTEEQSIQARVSYQMSGGLASLQVKFSEEEGMLSEQVRTLFFIIGLILVSGISDSWGFFHTAKMWRSEAPILSGLGKSALGFSIGIGSYWLAAKYLTEFGVLSPETQTLIWFGTTIMGVAFISGKFLQWHALDQIIAVVVLLG